MICCVGGGTIYPILLNAPIPWLKAADMLIPMMVVIWLLVHRTDFGSVWDVLPARMILAAGTGLNHAANVVTAFTNIRDLLTKADSESVFALIFLTSIAGAGGGIILPWFPAPYRDTRMKSALEIPNWWLQSAFSGAVFLVLTTGTYGIFPTVFSVPQARVIFLSWVIFHGTLRAAFAHDINDPPMFLDIFYRLLFSLTGLERSTASISNFEKAHPTKPKAEQPILHEKQE